MPSWTALAAPKRTPYNATKLSVEQDTTGIRKNEDYFTEILNDLPQIEDAVR